MNKIKNQMDHKLELIESMSYLEKSIDDTIKNFEVNNINNTIIGEYVNINRLQRQRSVFPNIHSKSKKNSIIRNYFYKTELDMRSNTSDFDFFQKKFNSVQKKFNSVQKIEFFELEKLENYEFNFLNPLLTTDNKFAAVYTMLYSSGVLEQFKIKFDVLRRFLIETHKLYEQHKNPYHNFSHALTVLNGCFYFLKKSESISYFNEVSIAAFLFASLMHDINHTGHNNDFEIKSVSELAFRYNDQHVLENHHCYTAFDLLRKNDLNILANMKKDEFQEFRKICIELILMTDPKYHFVHLKKFDSLVSKYGKDEFYIDSNFNNFIELAGNMIHCADLYGPCKPLEESKKWSDMINQEFFSQLEKEEQQNLPVTKFFKDLKNPSESFANQIFFIEKIVKPLWVSLDNFLDKPFEKELVNLNLNLEVENKKLKKIMKKKFIQ